MVPSTIAVGSQSIYTKLLLLAAIALSAVHAQPSIGGCAVFPANNIWNVPIDNLPVDQSSAAYVNSIGPAKGLHADFSSSGGGIPYQVVPASQPAVPISFDSSDSDPGPYPIPPNPLIETGSDQHALIVQQGTCVLYEVYLLSTNPDGSWHGSSGAIFNLNSNALRPSGLTSADAAGLPILPGLVKYDEIASGTINHALRMTAPQTQKAFVWPGRHYASSSTDPTLPPMGQRFRLQASFDITSYPPAVQVLLQALKKYGAMLADNGSSWYITGVPDPRWDDDAFHTIGTILGSNMEAVDVSSLMVSPNSGYALIPSPSTARNDVPWSATPNFDLSTAITQSMTLTGDVTSSTIQNLVDGQQVTFLICQDSQGGHAFQWPSNVKGGMQIGAAPGLCSAQSFVSNGTNLYATSHGRQSM